MTIGDTPVWCVNAGKGESRHKAADVQRLFLQYCYIAVGWAELGDLSQLVDDRASLSSLLRSTWPGYKPGGPEQGAGALIRFVREANIGDIVVFRPGESNDVHVGRLAGPYIYNPALDEHYPHVRPVVWKAKLNSNQDLSDEARRVFQTSLSFFQVRQGVPEFQGAVVQAEKH